MTPVLANAQVDGGATAPSEARATETTSEERAAAGPDRAVHRLRDLDRRGRWVAGAFAVALALAPAVAFLRYLPDWVPAGDPAYMGLRALDVGTGRTPLVGQPSTSAEYVDGAMVHHLGPTHFYLMAPFVRLLGVAVGMLLVSVLLTGGSVLVAAWGVFRQLGPRAGAVAAVVLTGITFTTGASSLVNPVSSSISGYPLLCSAALLWCLLCGDLRLLPLTALVVSFTAQQHLAVLPALALMTVIAAAGCVALERRRGEELIRRAGWAVVVAGVTWSPVLVQELLGRPGNISQLSEFAGSSDRPRLGADVAVEQVVHALGVPPLIGQTDIDGGWFFRPMSPLTWVSASAVTGLLAFAAVRWARAGERRSAMLGAMALIVALGGLVNGSSVPIGVEQFRLPFYHWAFVLDFFVLTGLVLFAGQLMAGLRAVRERSWGSSDRAVLVGRRVAVGLALAVMVVPALVNPALDRRTNGLVAAYAPVGRSVLDGLVDDVVAHRDELTGPVVVLTRGEGLWVGLREALALALEERGIEVRHPIGSASFVHEDHLARADEVEGGVVLVVDKDHTTDAAQVFGVPGRVVADDDRRREIDREALGGLLDAVEGVDEVVPGPELEALLAEQTPEAGYLMRALLASFVGEDAARHLQDRDNVELLLEYPTVAPAFDRDDLERVLASLPSAAEASGLVENRWRLRVFVLDHEEAVEFGGWELVPDGDDEAAGTAGAGGRD